MENLLKCQISPLVKYRQNQKKTPERFKDENKTFTRNNPYFQCYENTCTIQAFLWNKCMQTNLCHIYYCIITYITQVYFLNTNKTCKSASA